MSEDSTALLATWCVGARRGEPRLGGGYSTQSRCDVGDGVDDSVDDGVVSVSSLPFLTSIFYYVLCRGACVQSLWWGRRRIR